MTFFIESSIIDEKRITNRLRLKVLWLNKGLGFAIDFIVLHKTYPLTSYYFWPQSQAWEQLKFELDCKPGITEVQRIKILNLVSEIMSVWKTSKNRTISETLLNQFSDVTFVKLKN